MEFEHFVGLLLHKFNASSCLRDFNVLCPDFGEFPNFTRQYSPYVACIIVFVLTTLFIYLCK
jgi:hypothetical protein